MLTQSEADNLSRRVMFLEKDRARMCERIKKLEERLDAIAPAAPKDAPPCVLVSIICIFCIIVVFDLLSCLGGLGGISLLPRRG